MMKFLFYLLILFSIFSCNEASSLDDETPTYQETKLTLEEQEKANPTEFLTVNGSYRKNIVGQWVIEGTIQNKASIATYKDVVVVIVYNSKTKTFLGTDNETFFEYIKPNGSHSFKIKKAGYKDAASITLGLSSASNVE